ncbi:hypothetical protein JXR93_00685, partial [bacterium]|nr:hypothetical protein [bacterium]
KVGLFFGKIWVQIMFILIAGFSIFFVVLVNNNRGNFEIRKGVFVESDGFVQSIYKKAATGKNDRGKYYYEMNYKYNTDINSNSIGNDFIKIDSCFFPKSFNPETPKERVGDIIKLKYSKNYPESSKVISPNSCTKSGEGVVLIPTIMMAIVFIIILGRFLFWYLSTIDLLKNGVFSYGRLISHKYISGKNAHWKLTFEYSDEGKKSYQKTVSISSKGEANSLMDDSEEALLYSYKNPKKVIFFDILGGKLSVSNSGKFKSLMANPYILLILPLLSLSFLLWAIKVFISVAL